MKLLVTGGAGFIGSAVVRMALAQGHTVVNVDALTYAASLSNLSEATRHAHYSFEHADIRDGGAMMRILERHCPDAIVHLAAESHVDRSIDSPLLFVETNVLGTCNLLEAARHHYLARKCPAGFRFLHVSTDEVFGSLGETGHFHEETPYAPRSPYAASKAASDHFVRAYGETYGLPVIVTNCSNNYGPYQFPEKLIPVIILSALAGKPIPVYGQGRNVRDWLYVDDHASALLTIVESGEIGCSYAIGGSSEARNIDIVAMVCDQLDTLRPRRSRYFEQVAFVNDRPGHDFRYAIDASRLRRQLRWLPTVTLQEGLAHTVRWYLDNEWWWRTLLERDECEERLGAA